MSRGSRRKALAAKRQQLLPGAIERVAAPLQAPQPWHARWRALIQTGEVAAVIACVIGALSVGGDMTIAIPVLVFAAVLSVVRIAGIQKLRTIWKIVSSAVVSFLLLLIVVFIYLHHMNSPSPPDNHLKPEIALSLTYFDATADPNIEGRWPLLWTAKTDDSNSKIVSSSFSIPLRNVGLGPAKTLAVSWSFPILSMIDELNKRAQRARSQADFAVDKGILVVKSKALGDFYSLWRNQQTQTFDYLAQAGTVMLRLPQAYILATSAWLYLGTIVHQPPSGVPALTARFEYLDIANEKHQACFDIDLTISALGGGTPSVGQGTDGISGTASSRRGVRPRVPSLAILAAREKFFIYGHLDAKKRIEPIDSSNCSD